MRIGLLLIAFAVLANVATVLPAHAGADENSLPLSCDGSIVANFKPNAETKVLLVKAYKKGDPFPEPPQESRSIPPHRR